MTRLPTVIRSPQAVRSCLCLLLAAGACLFAGDYPEKTIYVDLSVRDKLKRRDWSGRAEISEGEILRVEKTSGAMDSLRKDGSWVVVYGRGLKPGATKPTRSKAIVLTVSAPDDAVVSVLTKAGDFTFKVGEVTRRGISRLGGDVRVRLGKPLPKRRRRSRSKLPPAQVAGRLPSERVSDPTRQSDWPATAVTADGAVWTVYVQWNGNDADRIVVRRKAGGAWGRPIVLDDGSRDHYSPALAPRGNGVLAVWSANTNGDFELYTAEIGPKGRPSRPTRLTRAPYGDFNPRLAATRDGEVTLVWQSFRNGTSDVYARRLTGRTWGDEIRLSPSPANDWEPKVAVDSGGRAWVSWDSYARGNYDVFLRSLDASGPGKVIPVTTEPEAQFHSSVAVDQQDRVWVAWDQADKNWGLDFSRSSAVPGSRGLHDSRTLGIRVLTNGEVREPKTSMADILTGRMSRYAELPTLAVDGHGNLWLVFRHWTLAHPTEMYDFYVTRLTDGGWTKPWLLSNSRGRNSQLADVAKRPDGAIQVAWSSDLRAPDNLPKDQVHSLLYNAYTTTLPPEKSGGFPELVPVELPPPGKPGPRRVRATMTVGETTYTLMYGDCHRHTDIRGHSGVDGSILDTFRYARDPAQLDFLGFGDHNEVFGGRWPDGLRDYSWWYTQKLVDLFTCEPYFVGVYSYEHSMSRPAGHRNLLFLRRGAPLRAIDRADTRGPANKPPELWKWAREKVLTQRNQKIVIVPHTFASGPLADWNWPNAPFDSVLEIYQGCRGSYEKLGLPPGEKRGPTQTKKPGHFAQDALDRGNTYGFVSFSDHGSTHNSWAGVWAEKPTRAAIFDALLARRTFGASDEIVVRMSAGDHAMGEQFEAAKPLELSIDVTAPHPLLRVDLIKDGRVVWSGKPTGTTLSATFRDARAAPGRSYYYVRVLQTDPDPPRITYPGRPGLRDPEMAWGSPVFVTYR